MGDAVTDAIGWLALAAVAGVLAGPAQRVEQPAFVDAGLTVAYSPTAHTWRATWDDLGSRGLSFYGLQYGVALTRDGVVDRSSPLHSGEIGASDMSEASRNARAYSSTLLPWSSGLVPAQSFFYVQAVYLCSRTDETGESDCSPLTARGVWRAYSSPVKVAVADRGATRDAAVRSAVATAVKSVVAANRPLVACRGCAGAAASLKSAVASQLRKLRPLDPASATVARGLAAARTYLRYVDLAATAYERSHRAAHAGDASAASRWFALCRSRYDLAGVAWERARALLWPG